LKNFQALGLPPALSSRPTCLRHFSSRPLCLRPLGALPSDLNFHPSFRASYQKSPTKNFCFFW